MNAAAASSSKNCVEAIFARLETCRSVAILEECREDGPVVATGEELLSLVSTVRARIRKAGVPPGDRCGLLAENGIRWVAANLAIFAEGLICVPLYSRQAPEELAAMLADSEPSLLLCSSAVLRDSLSTEVPQAILFEELFAVHAPGPARMDAPLALTASDPMTILYTSGTSGVSKGVLLSIGNVSHVLDCTSSRLDLLMGVSRAQDHVFHYLPLCFAGSWMLLLTSLLRGSLLTLNTDLTRIPTELPGSAPDYILNVPALLERMRRAVDEQVFLRGGLTLKIYSNAKRTFQSRKPSIWIPSSSRRSGVHAGCTESSSTLMWSSTDAGIRSRTSTRAAWGS